MPNEADRRLPLASPLLASDEALSLLEMPHLIIAAELDILRSEAEAYASRLEALGKSVDLQILFGLPHVSPAMDGTIPRVQEMVQMTISFIGKTLMSPTA